MNETRSLVFHPKAVAQEVRPSSFRPLPNFEFMALGSDFDIQWEHKYYHPPGRERGRIYGSDSMRPSCLHSRVGSSLSNSGIQPAVLKLIKPYTPWSCSRVSILSMTRFILGINRLPIIADHVLLLCINAGSDVKKHGTDSNLWPSWVTAGEIQTQ